MHQIFRNIWYLSLVESIHSSYKSKKSSASRKIQKLLKLQLSPALSRRLLVLPAEPRDVNIFAGRRFLGEGSRQTSYLFIYFSDNKYYTFGHFCSDIFPLFLSNIFRSLNLSCILHCSTHMFIWSILSSIYMI